MLLWNDKNNNINMHKKKVKTSFAPDLDLFLLPEINTIYNLP